MLNQGSAKVVVTTHKIKNMFIKKNELFLANDKI